MAKQPKKILTHTDRILQMKYTIVKGQMIMAIRSGAELRSYADRIYYNKSFWHSVWGFGWLVVSQKKTQPSMENDVCVFFQTIFNK